MSRSYGSFSDKLCFICNGEAQRIKEGLTQVHTWGSCSKCLTFCKLRLYQLTSKEYIYECPTCKYKLVRCDCTNGYISMDPVTKQKDEKCIVCMGIIKDWPLEIGKKKTLPFDHLHKQYEQKWRLLMTK
eukprot:TRINITY_DN6542_c0_g1_i1.p1 TRINITY_DN6542_c0_g1~~TRINITY_DN6542_c0_g1_i1.p1  ORF type:complete len:129 (-),score=22.69 TRINITY_DN6542_c0_g1_i1:14-400(-)